jgi:UDP-glucuronate 4-epimerase
MKILITGTAGFIGFHLANRLLKEGHTVIGYDSVCDYYPTSIKRRRLEILAGHGERSIFVEADLCDFETMEATFKTHQPELVCNLAAQAGVRYSIEKPFVYQKANLEGFLNILECCRHNGVQRLVYASSSSVYGGNKDMPFSEDARVDGPISLYAATKKANELMAHCYSHLYGLQTVGLRFFTVYGPWGRPDMAMWIFAEKILRGEPIPVFNHGKMQRDFTYYEDIVSGVCGSLFTPGLDPCEVFNLGNHNCEVLMDMINLIEDGIGRKAELNLLPMQPGDVPATYADISRAQSKLGFEPTTPINVGVPKFCEWYLAHPEFAEDAYNWRNSE